MRDVRFVWLLQVLIYAATPGKNKCFLLTFLTAPLELLLTDESLGVHSDDTTKRRERVRWPLVAFV